MKAWAAISLGVLVCASIMIFYGVNYIALLFYGVYNLSFPPAYIHPITWVLIGGTWLLGLATMKFWYDRGAPKQPQQPVKDWKHPFSREGKEEPPKSGARTLGEIAKKFENLPQVTELQTYPGSMPSKVTREVQKNDGSEIGHMVEGVVGDSLADAEMSMELEVPEGTKLTVFGQQLEVRKGKIRIKPRHRTQKKIEELFGNKGRRKPA